MKYMEDTKEEEQCKAFSKFYNSSYEFSQVEQPLLLHQTFPSFITFMTVLRHPIERVISSYRMIRNTYLNEEDWTMKSWLLHEKHSPIYKVNPNRRRMSNSNPNKQFPHPDSQTSQIISSKPKVFQKLINSSNSSWKIVPKKNFSNIRSPRILPTDGLDENYMTKWFCGLWFQQNAPPVSEECYERAVENLNKFDFIFLTQYLSTDLPHVAKELGMNLTEEELKNVIPYNIRMHDPHLENERNISYSTNISNPSSIPEFSENDGTYEIAIKKNHYDLKLYRHAIYRNCLTLRKDTVSSCQYVADHTALIYLW